MAFPGTTPLASSPSTSNDPTEILRQIEKNTQATLQWTKYLVGAVFVLIIVFALALFA